MNQAYPQQIKFRYQQIARQLAREIRAHYRAGQRFESEPDLCARLQVTRNTVRKAIDMLVEEGLLEGRGRAGNYVSDFRETAYDDRLFCVAMPIRNHLCDDIFLSLSHHSIAHQRYALICDLSGKAIDNPFGQLLEPDQIEHRLGDALAFRPRTLVVYLSVLPATVAAMRGHFRNLIMLNAAAPPGFAHSGAVSADYPAAWRLCARHAVAAGYRRACLFVPPTAIHLAELQHAIAEATGNELSLRHQRVLFEHQPDWQAELIAFAQASADPLAVLTSYDWGAHLARAALATAGLADPDQVGIYGMNDTGWAIQDSLTSVAFSPDTWAEEVFAVDAALDAGEPAVVRLVPPAIVERASTRSAPIRR